ncbi:hypothetical protein ABZY06_34920 [Streptomyces sp. NPDC006540]|uniref:hypothetical protein n=1 Tax=Streptomyces sp. NPDC006540 TaxID=3155353 RepID=UPI0033A05E1F
MAGLESGTAGIATPTTIWRQLGRPTARRRELWARSSDVTRWVACGRDWDAVAVQPLGLGLEALDRMGLGPDRGYPVLADLAVRNELYVLVAPGTAEGAEELPGVRLLGPGRQLLVPATGHGTPCAHWISAPRASSPLLARGDQLVGQLRALLNLPAKPNTESHVSGFEYRVLCAAVIGADLPAPNEPCGPPAHHPHRG